MGPAPALLTSGPAYLPRPTIVRTVVPAPAVVRTVYAPVKVQTVYTPPAPVLLNAPLVKRVVSPAPVIKTSHVFLNAGPTIRRSHSVLL